MKSLKRHTLIVTLALVALLGAAQASASTTMTGAKARAMILAEEPTATVERCHRRSLRLIRCRVLTALTATKTVTDAATGEVVAESTEVIGYMPFIADVRRGDVQWRFLPGYAT